MSDVTNPPRDRAAAVTKAQSYFQAADARTELVKQMIKAETAARDAKTAKLRALRLAKEEAERAEALANPAPPGTPTVKRRH